MSIKTTKLKNGLTVVTDYMSEVDTVSVNIRVKVGSLSESKEDSGLSHLIEHMMFKGTNKRTAKEIFEGFDNIGGEVNACTSKSYTEYNTTVISEDLEKAVELFSDMLLHSRFGSKELEREKKVVIQELAQSKDTPSHLIFEYSSKTSYPNQSRGRDIGGTVKTVKSFTRNDLFDHVKQYYKTTNVIIGFAGNSKHRNNLKLVKAYFGCLRKGVCTREVSSRSSSYVGGSRRVNKKGLEQVQVVMSFEGVSYLSDQYYTAKILGSILGGGMSSRLWQEVREKKGLCYAMHAWCSTNRDTGMLSVYSSVSPKKADELISTVISELNKALRNITQEEVDRSVAQFKTGLLVDMERTKYRAWSVCTDLQCWDRVIPTKEIIKKLNKITVNEVTNLLQEMMNSKPTLALLGDLSKIRPYKEIKKGIIIL